MHMWRPWGPGRRKELWRVTQRLGRWVGLRPPPPGGGTVGNGEGRGGTDRREERHLVEGGLRVVRGGLLDLEGVGGVVGAEV